MIEVLQGQVVDGKYPLLQYLGGTEHSTVFLTNYAYGRDGKAAIKLVEAIPGYAEAQLIRWRLAAKFSHRHLLRIFEMDRCKVDGASMLYVVMEQAEENLADTLLERPLSPAETHDLLGPMLEVLGYIHSKGFVHGHVQPSNIMAISDQVKISSDGICRIDESTEWRNQWTRYTAPEYAADALSPASDVWSLGATMVECFTEHWLKIDAGSREEVSLPLDLPGPFLELARHCLVRDPQRRWTIPQLKARLQRTAVPEPEVVAVVAPSRPPAPSVPATSASTPILVAPPALTATATASLAQAPAAPTPIPPRPAPAAIPRPSRATAATTPATVNTIAARIANQRNALALTALGLAAAIVLIVIALLHLGSNASNPGATAARPLRAARGGVSGAPVRRAAAGTPESLHPVAATGLMRGDVTHRVLPRVPRDASNTIWGTVRVRVRVKVDPSGNVVGAKFDWPGPSHYFARLSMAAAREWKFHPPSVNGKVVTSEWVIYFDYRKTGRNATATERNP